MKASPRLRHLRRYLLLPATVWALCILPACAVFSSRASKWEQQVVRDPDGVLLHARARSWGDGDPALLLIHGFADGPHVWKNLGPALADRGYTVRAMRLPGWNEPLKVKHGVTYQDWQQAIRDEAAALRADHGRLAVIGHSLGGCLATSLVQSGDLAPDALVLYAPMFGVSNARSPILTTRTWFRILRRVLPRRMVIENLFTEQSAHQTPRPATERDPYNPKNIFVQLYALMEVRDAQEPFASCPVSLSVSSIDRVVDSDKALDWFAALDAPHKDLRIVEEAGHVLPLDVDVLAEADRLDVWFRQHGIAP